MHCVLLHSSMSSGQQWQPLTQALTPASAQQSDIHCITPDFSGYGHAAMPAHPRTDHKLQWELEQLAEHLPETPFHLVGHSYGAATALRLARLHPEQVISLSLFEPVAFHLLDHSHPQYQAVQALSGKIDHFIDQGNALDAADCFIDYWNGQGTFKRLNEQMQTAFSQGILKVAYDFQALMSEACQPDDLASIHCPVLLLEGADSQPSAHAVMEVLRSAFPAATHHSLPCGHMGPLTHPESVNPLVSNFIATHNKDR